MEKNWPIYLKESRKKPSDITRSNCGFTTVRRRWQWRSNEMIYLIAGLASCGGGKSSGGLCGALYVARQIVAEISPETVDSLTARFWEMVGSLLCREIRQGGKTPCVECVRIAARLAAEELHTC